MALIVISLTMLSCSDDWDNHYKQKVMNKSDLNLYDYIKSQEDLGIFTTMLEITGYDSILSNSQTFTVWAPTDNSLQGVDLNDEEMVIKIVTNHITRFSHPTLEAENKFICALNNKLLLFTKNGESFSYDGNTIIRSDLATFNGIVHVINGFVPYRMSHWEYMMKSEGLDSLRNYLKSLDYRELDYEASFEDEVFIDSIFKVTNIAKIILGDLDIEDSVYTMIVPDNIAWSEAKNRIMPFYKCTPASGGLLAQTEYSKWTLLRDLIFRGRISLPVSDNELVSTFKTVFKNPGLLFEGCQKNVLSNGYSYRTSQLNYKAEDTWLKEIRIEAEDIQEGQRIAANYTVNNVSGLGTGFDISGNEYITCIPKTSSSISKLSLKFPLPNTLSAKYNIYVVFVPTYAIDKTDKRPYKLNYFLSYMNAEGKQVTDSKLTIANNKTDSISMTKVLIAENFQFPYCNIVDGVLQMGNPVTSVFLKVENATGITAVETANFNRTIRIDCIILEPVK